MQLRRGHLVKREFAAFRLPRCCSQGIGKALLAAAAISGSAFAQDTKDSPRTSVARNTLRENASLAKQGAGLSGAGWADAIQLRSLPQHVEPPVVTAISVSPDGKSIAAAGDDHAIRIVDLETGKTTATLLGHFDWVQAVEFSPNGQQLASCGNDGTLCVWSLGGDAKMIAKRTAPHALLTLAYLNDERIYAAGFGNRIYRFDTFDAELKVVHSCDCRDIRSIVISPDRTRIAFAGRDGVLRVRDVSLDGDSSPEAEKKEIVVALHSDRIRTLTFSSDGNQITSVGEDRRIVHYDLATRTILAKTEIGGGKLFGLCQLEPHLFAIASSDNTIRIFNETDNRVCARLVGHDGSVSILKRTKTHLISGSFDTTIRVWDIERALSSIDNQGRYTHPVAAQFEDSGAGAEVK